PGHTPSAAERAPRGERRLSQNARKRRPPRTADLAGRDPAVDPQQLDGYLGAYELTASRMLSVTREGDRLFVEESGQPRFAVTARGVDAFSGDNGYLVIFLRNELGKVKQVLIQEPAFGAMLARWVAPARAKTVQDEFARRIAEVPDRFRDQAPMPGSKEAILRGIADMQRGAPNYERMSAALATKIRRQASELEATLK